jgi:hypothetical protein
LLTLLEIEINRPLPQAVLTFISQGQRTRNVRGMI